MTTRPRDLLPLLIAFAAFVLRLWRLDAQSLRGDEAFDVLFASQPLGEIIHQLQINQIYPPLFHTLDHFWLLVAGTSQFSARFLAFGAGVLLVPLAFCIARDLFDQRTAHIAMVLVAVHPFLLWHAQDGRMYEMLALLVLLAAWCAVRVSEQAAVGAPSIPWLAAYGLAALLAIMTHYFAYIAIFAINLAMLALWLARRWPLRLYAHWFAANFVVGVCGAGWIALAWSRFSTHTADWITPSSPLDVLERSLVAYSLGTTVDWNLALPFVVLSVGLAFLGVIKDSNLPGAVNRAMAMTRPGLGPGISPASQMLLILIFIPLITIYLGSLWRPMYDEKFLIFIVPFYMLLVARGASALRGAQWVASAAIVLGMGLSLYNYDFDPRFTKSPPWREAAQAILANAQAGDVVIYNYPDPSLSYQIGSALPVVLLPAQGPYEAGATPSDAVSAERDLSGLSDRYTRIWFFPQSAPNWDKDGVVGLWLGRFADEDWSASIGTLKVERYLTARADRALWTPVNAGFDDYITLKGYRLPDAAASLRIGLVLYWEASQKPSKDYTVFAHVLNEAGQLVAQQDNPPVGGTYPTSQWQSGKIIVDRYVIMTKEGLPPGHYRFEIGLYDAAGARLRVGADDKVVFGNLIR